MKAAFYDSPGPADVLGFEEIPDPQYDQNDVLVAVEAISIEAAILLIAAHPQCFGLHLSVASWLWEE